MKVSIRKVTEENFKGIRFRESVFDSDKIDVIGYNGSGKTTLGMACQLPFTKKDLSGKANPELHPDFMEESEPHITLECEMDGKPITIELIQKDTRSKKEREEGTPPKTSNVYRVNGVEKSETAFKADMLERGLNLSLYERLSNPEYFTNLKENDKRKAVFEMVSDISDIDVADSIGEGAAEVRKQLDNYKLEEIDAIAKQNKKKSDALMVSLPEQIKGLESAIVDIDIDGLNQQKSELSLKLSDMSKQLDELYSVSKSAINSKIAELTSRQRVLESEINIEREKNIHKCRTALNDAQSEYKFVMSKTESLEGSLERMNKIFHNTVLEFNRLTKEREAIENTKYHADNIICETCGQILPPGMREEAERNWLNSKNERLLNCDRKINVYKKQVGDIKEKIDEIEKELDENRKKETELSRKYDVLKNDLELAEAAPANNVWDNEEFKKLNVEIETLKASLANTDAVEQKRLELTQESMEVEDHIREIDMTLAKEEVNARTRGEIQKLRKQQREVGQNQANAEKILHQVSLINKRKNEMLSESINSKFADFIKFKLFLTLKNGEEKDCCIPLVRDENGDWKELGKTANTALEMRAKLAILDGFQKYHNMHVPIIVDNASELDAESKRQINLDTQIIFLSVDDSDFTIKYLN